MFFMIMLINKLIIFFLKKIVKDMSDSQIKLMQNWLSALSNALFALRSEAKHKTLSFEETDAKSVFEKVDKNVRFWSTCDEKLRLCSFSIELPRKPGEDFIETTRCFRLFPNAKSDETFLRPTGRKEHRIPDAFTNAVTHYHSTFGIEIIDLKDS